MTTGKYRRMRRLFGGNDTSMISVPIDHGMQVGAIDGLEDMATLIDAIADGGADSVIVNPGILRQYHKQLERIPSVILRLDQTTMWRTGTAYGYDSTHTRQVASVQEAVSLGADAVITYLFTCNADPAEETKCFEINRAVATEARAFGMPHIIEAMAANGGFAAADDPELVRMNCRIAAEFGADIVKTDWCGAEGIASVTSSCPVPVCIAGGAKSGNTDELVDIAQQAIKNGARGVFFGRNIFQRQDVAKTINQLRKVVKAR